MYTASGISHRFRRLSRAEGQVTHALLTRPPLSATHIKYELHSARLACLRRAASVRPEPGSNSPSRYYHGAQHRNNLSLFSGFQNHS